MAKRDRRTKAEARRAWRRIRADCSEEVGAFLDSLGLTVDQRAEVARGIRTVQAVARTRGRDIGIDEALGKMASMWLQHPPV